MPELYRDYFDIDPEYFPVVNASVIAEHPDLWQKFYPHESFVQLLEGLVNAINRKHKLSVWVEGAYGTGKSHAVLTAKKLLDADNETVKQYFDRNSEKLSNDLYNRLCAVKSGAPLLTVHRYGCDEIATEQDMLFAVQDSITQALKERGFNQGGESALRAAALRWLGDESNRDYFNSLMLRSYPDLFGGDDVKALMQKLNTYTGVALGDVVGKMMKVARERGIHALSLNREDVVEWIKNVIKSNSLKAIVFFWDEFTEYFRNHQNQLTTFQTLVEMSESSEAPFYLIPVTHDVASLFPPKDSEWSKIRGRFYQPFCTITLPENIAFDLMGKAMEKKHDAVIRQEWGDYSQELYERTHDSRERVKKTVGLTDQELKDVLPVHPFAALLLKYLSSLFASDARSMFSFIKDDAGDEYRGFQWFINHFGPFDENPLLTIDMLWDFFYEKGKSLLAPNVRHVLDAYGCAGNLMGDEPRVLKTILLMRAIRDVGGNSGRLAELMAPTAKNLNHAFEGTDLEIGQAKKIADSLVRKNILYIKPGTEEYAVDESGSDETEIQAMIDEVRSKVRTVDLVTETILQGVDNPFRLTGALLPRYKPYYVSAENFTSTIGQIRNEHMGVQIPVVFGFARNQLDAQQISKLMANEAAKPENKVVLVDVSNIQLGNDRIEQYVDSKARQQYWLKKRGEQAAQYGKNVSDVLKEWRLAMGKGELVVFAPGKAQAQRTSLNNLATILREVVRSVYPLGLETFARNATDTMWQGTNFKSGAGLGAGLNKPLGQFSCVPKDLGNAWTMSRDQKYWEAEPNAPISKIKIFVTHIIEKAFSDGDRIAIRDIYHALTQPPYGFMPVAQTAFVFGFLLRDYTDGSYSSSDGLQTAKLDIETLQAMIESCMKNEVTPNARYKDQYIVRMTREIKAFMEGSSVVFGRPIRQARLEDVRNGIVRPGMKNLPFPMRCLVFAMDEVSESQRDDVRKLIELYAALANDGGVGSRSAEEIAKEIGQLFLKQRELSETLHRLMTVDCSRKGMQNYLKTFEDGTLIQLGQKVNDGGQYINELQKRFRSDEYKWLWQQDTIDAQIRSVTLDYRIIEQTNAVLRSKYTSFDESIEGWANACKYIHISYLNAKNYWQELKPLMEALYDIKRKGELPDAKRTDFLSLILAKGEAFWTFYTSGQVTMFKQVCSIELGDLNDEEVGEIYKRLGNTDCFAMEIQPYRDLVKNTVKAWMEGQKRVVLLTAWKNTTGTLSPKDWSDKYTMPILCMVSPEDEVTARSVFNTVNTAARTAISGDAVDRALRFIEEHPQLFDSLSDESARDEAFRRNMLGKNDIILSVEQVKSYLRQRMHCDPYDWYKLTEVEKEIEKLAQHEYEGKGYIRVSSIVDGMDAATAKRYLKALIEKNKTVGIEILREQHQ